MFDRFQIEELDAVGQTAWTWIVDVPRDNAQSPDTYKISRKKGYPGSAGNFTHLDGPAVKQSGMRKEVEEAILGRMRGVVRDILYDDRRNAKYRVQAKGSVQRYKSPQHKRMNSPLYAIALEQRQGKFALDAILDQEAPVRYQVVIDPRPGIDGLMSMEMLVYRRSNPRSRNAPEYQMMAMSAGRKRQESPYTDEQADAIEAAIANLGRVVPANTPMIKAVEQVRAVFQKSHYGHHIGDDSQSAHSNRSIASRLRELATTIMGTIMASAQNPTPDNIAKCVAIRDDMAAQRERLTPAFEAYLRHLETQAFLRQKENDAMKMQAKQARKGTQTTYNGTIPPMPTEAQIAALNAPNRLDTPATATANPLTAFLGGTAEVTALKPVVQPYQEPPAHDVVKPLEEHEVAEWLANLDKNPSTPPQPRPGTVEDNVRRPGESAEAWLDRITTYQEYDPDNGVPPPKDD